jgi:hypothetical protein
MFGVDRSRHEFARGESVGFTLRIPFRITALFPITILNKRSIQHRATSELESP